MNAIVLTSEQYQQIEREGEAAYPNECCGAMLGRDLPGGERIVERLLPLGNDFETGERFHRFSISPRDLMRVEKLAGEQKQSVLGFYHSHPDHPARPSEYDREHAWPFYSYIIVSIAKGAALNMTSWLLEEESARFERQEIRQASEATS